MPGSASTATAAAAVWLQFVVCAALIGLGGFQLTRHADAIARRTGLSGSWIGLALVATVTSLPELATGITSVTLADAPNLAVGNALGSCVLNLAFLVLIDFLFRQEPVWRRANQGHVLAAAFGVVLLGFTLVSLLVSHVMPGAPAAPLHGWPQLGFGLATPVVLALYLVAMRTVFTYERAHTIAAPVTAAELAAAPPLRDAAVRFALAALVVLGAGFWLPFVAVDLAAIMGWNRSFVGSLFMALVTTLPEMAVTVSALRLGALDMAIGNLLGSNLFNIAILAVDDLAYTRGPLLADAAPVHAGTAATALLMSGLVIVGLVMRPQGRVLRVASWISVGLVAAYGINAAFLFLAGS